MQTQQGLDRDAFGISFSLSENESGRNLVQPTVEHTLSTFSPNGSTSYKHADKIAHNHDNKLNHDDGRVGFEKTCDSTKKSQRDHTSPVVAR